MNRQVGFWLLMCFVMLIFKLSFHELWKDEWQAWFIVRDQSITELLHSLSVEGHPFLFYLYLKLFSVFIPVFESAQEFLIQFSHWLLYAIASYIFIFKFKLPLYIKLIALFGYFLFFEYGVVNRGYMLCVLFAFLSTHLISEKKPSFLLGLSLFLLTQTEVFGLMMAGAFCFYLLLESEGSMIERIKNVSIPVLSVILGAILFVLQLAPALLTTELSVEIANVQTAGSFLEAFQASFSNVFFIGLVNDTAQFGANVTGVMLSILALAILTYIFWNSRAILLSFIAYSIVIFILYQAFYLGGIRQWGMSFIFFLCLLSLDQGWHKSKYRRYLVIFLLGVQLIHSSRGVALEILTPFSHSQEAGRFLAENVPQEVPIIAINKMACSPVSGYADRLFYSLPTGETFSHFDWREKIYFPPQSELKLFAEYKRVSRLIVISPKELDPNRYPDLKKWKSYPSKNLKKENYYIYTYSAG